ncbi:hypothetical protein [Aquimarina brevivitae]|uniref:Lipoprotein n=1 Tax=Aquimarina brevivitae TaxID=323412 RepID=A0A4Q7PJV0_9FLAO|nr:hypothetical protein [Aquimarina brevivitae]RZS99192.1 hypothetical protein EV197_0401 [Aquimarina brevivitae]
MKRTTFLLLLFVMLGVSSCFDDDADGTRFYYELIPIEAVDIPNQFVSGETYTITTSYYRPSTCHSFSGYDYNRIGNERTVSVVNVVVDRMNCEDIEPTRFTEASFDFFVGDESAYVFRFWNGRNDEGENEFITIEVPVIQ